MWLFDRRGFLTAGGAFAVSACGFTPVYAPGGGGDQLLGQVEVDAPDTPDAYLFTRRFEERLGRAGPAPRYRMKVTLSTSQTDLGTISSGSITRFRINGTAVFAVRDADTAAPVFDSRTTAFTGFSTTGSTVATLSAERDAGERLMFILADQVIDALILASADFPA